VSKWYVDKRLGESKGGKKGGRIEYSKGGRVERDETMDTSRSK
jgi:hypothetical protein